MYRNRKQSNQGVDHDLRVVRWVVTMGRAHDRLHDVTTSDVGRYLESLVRDLRDITPDGIRVHVDIAAADVSLADMLPVGLIVNELVTDHALHGGGRDLHQQGIRRLGGTANRDEHRSGTREQSCQTSR